MGEDITALRLFYVAPSYEEAKRDADHILTPYLRRFGRYAPKDYFLDDDDKPRPISDLDWEYFRKQLMIIAGSPEQVAEQLHETEERYGIDTIALHPNATDGPDIFSHKQIMSCLDLFASKVLPLFANGKSGSGKKAEAAQV